MDFKTPIRIINHLILGIITNIEGDLGSWIEILLLQAEAQEVC